MTIKSILQFYLKDIFEFVKNNAMLVLKPRSIVQKLRNKPLSLKSFLIKLLFIVIIHSILNYIVTYVKYPSNQWDIVNICGVTWQILVFIVFVITFSPLLIDLISSKVSGTQSQLYQLSKVYLHVLLIFALYPIVNLVATLFRWPNDFLLPFAKRSSITIGQICEGILICYVSIFIIYSFYKSKKAVLLSLLVIGISFPLILYGIDFVYFLSSAFYKFLIYGSTNDPAHIILWCMENTWFCLLILLFGALYFSYKRKDSLKKVSKVQIIPNIIFSALTLGGYFIGGSILPLSRLISLIIASIGAWNFIYLLWTFYSRNTSDQEKVIQMNKWEYFMSGFWLFTIAISLSLIVSFISGFFIVIYFIASTFYLKHGNLKSSSIIIQKMFLFLLFYSTLSISAVPTYFFVFYGSSVIAIDFPTLFSLIVAIPIAGMLAISLKTKYFFR